MLDSPVPIQALKSTNIGPGAMPVLIRALGVAGIGSDTDAAKRQVKRVNSSHPLVVMVV